MKDFGFKFPTDKKDAVSVWLITLDNAQKQRGAISHLSTVSHGLEFTGV